MSTVEPDINCTICHGTGKEGDKFCKCLEDPRRGNRMNDDLRRLLRLQSDAQKLASTTKAEEGETGPLIDFSKMTRAEIVDHCAQMFGSFADYDTQAMQESSAALTKVADQMIAEQEQQEIMARTMQGLAAQKVVENHLNEPPQPSVQGPRLATNEELEAAKVGEYLAEEGFKAGRWENWFVASIATELLERRANSPSPSITERRVEFLLRDAFPSDEWDEEAPGLALKVLVKALREAGVRVE